MVRCQTKTNAKLHMNTVLLCGVWCDDFNSASSAQHSFWSDSACSLCREYSNRRRHGNCLWRRRTFAICPLCLCTGDDPLPRHSWSISLTAIVGSTNCRTRNASCRHSGNVPHRLYQIANFPNGNRARFPRKLVQNWRTTDSTRYRMPPAMWLVCRVPIRRPVRFRCESRWHFLGPGMLARETATPSIWIWWQIRCRSENHRTTTISNWPLLCRWTMTSDSWSLSRCPFSVSESLPQLRGRRESLFRGCPVRRRRRLCWETCTSTYMVPVWPPDTICLTGCWPSSRVWPATPYPVWSTFCLLVRFGPNVFIHWFVNISSPGANTDSMYLPADPCPQSPVDVTLYIYRSNWY